MPWYLWRLLRSHPWLFAVSAVLSVGYSSVPLLVGLILREFFEPLKIPVVSGLPVGHLEGKQTLRLGGSVEIESDARLLRCKP